MSDLRDLLVPLGDPSLPNDDLLHERLIEAAMRHGLQGDPDHEVGDLQEIIREIWPHVPATARAELAAGRAEYLDAWLGEEHEKK